MKVAFVLLAFIILFGCRRATPNMTEDEQTAAIIEIQKQLANLAYLNQLQFRKDSTIVSLADTVRVRGLITDYLLIRNPADYNNDTILKTPKKPDSK